MSDGLFDLEPILPESAIVFDPAQRPAVVEVWHLGRRILDIPVYHEVSSRDQLYLNCGQTSYRVRPYHRECLN